MEGVLRCYSDHVIVRNRSDGVGAAALLHCGADLRAQEVYREGIVRRQWCFHTRLRRWFKSRESVLPTKGGGPELSLNSQGATVNQRHIVPTGLDVSKISLTNEMFK